MSPTIVNSGFEDVVLQDGGFTVAQPIPGWQVYDPNNLFTTPGFGSNYATLNPQTISYANEATLGNVSASYLENPIGSGEAGLSQTLPDLLTAGKTYTLRVKVGNPLPDEFTGTGFPGYAVQLLAGGKLLAEDRNTKIVDEGAFITSTVTYQPAANDVNLGQPLEIRLLNILQGTGREVNFNDVSLDVSIPDILNPGFESPSIPADTVAINQTPGWSLYNPYNVVDGNDDSSTATFHAAELYKELFYPQGVPEGNNAVGIFLVKPPGSGVVGLTQKLESTLLQPNTTYTLKFDLGNIAPSADFPLIAGFPGYAVQLRAGDEVVAQTVNEGIPPDGTFAPRMFTYTTSANPRNVGQPLEIRLLNLLQFPGEDVNFDNIRLDINPVIVNAGFEEIPLEDNGFAARNIPGWQVYDPSNLFANQGSNYSTLNPATSSYVAEAPQGNNVAGLYLDNPVGSGIAGISQTLNQVVKAGTTYTLTVDVGNAAPDEFTGIGFPGYGVQLVAGDRVVAQDFNAFRPGRGLFGFSTISYTPRANDPNLGKQLEIRLLNTLTSTGKEVGFDNVRLTESKVPPGLFNEAYYLQNNTDIAGAVGSGLLPSGLEHFNLKGVHEGRTLVTPYFSEASYLQKYADVAAAVTTGAFSSGLQHFLEFGYNEARSPDIGIPGSGDVYLRKYADVGIAVAAGIFKSWYDHFLQFGLAEDRSPTYFDPNDYRLFYADAVAAIADPNDNIVSAFDHFVQIGQFEERLPIFSGTAGNDTIQGFGIKPYLFGVDFEITSADPFNYALLSTGSGEIDTLVGSPGRENFELGYGSTAGNPNPKQFYVGGGAADYAIVRNFERGVDVIELPEPLSNITQQVSGGNLNILAGGDLVGVVEGITTPLTSANGDDFFPQGQTFFLS